MTEADSGREGKARVSDSRAPSAAAPDRSGRNEPVPGSARDRGAADRAYHRVTNAEQARLLTEPAYDDAFRPFLARECSVGEAAAEAGLTLDAMLYRVRVLLKAGLLEVARVKPRAGRPIKLYRSVHDAYFIPYELTPFASLEERLWRQFMPELKERLAIQARRLRERGFDGQRLYRNDFGETFMESAPDALSPVDFLDSEREPALDFWTNVALTEQRAREVQRTLYDLWRRSQEPEAEVGDGKRRYRLAVAFVPLDD